MRFLKRVIDLKGTVLCLFYARFFFLGFLCRCLGHLLRCTSFWIFLLCRVLCLDKKKVLLLLRVIRFCLSDSPVFLLSDM